MLLLRSPDGRPPSTVVGNHFLQRLVGATTRFIAPEQYERRDELMAAAATELSARGEKAWVIPEGASDALGMWAFVLAAREVAEQWSSMGGGGRVTWWHAASSGGTTAGLGWGADRLRSDVPIVASSVGESAGVLRGRVEAIWSEAATPTAALPTPDLEYLDEYVGLGYGRTTREELEIQVEISRLTGLVLDPTYTGKAFVALKHEIDAGRFDPDEHVIFWHTGGGFAAFAHDYGEVL
jgi:D-cysteine desulfhydrase